MRQYRKQMLASVIRNVVGTAIAHRLHDPRVEPLTTVTRVELTSDLLIARVFVSVPGGDAAERRTACALRHAAGFVQRLVAAELTIRHCPEIRFDIDESLKIARKTLALLDEVRVDESVESPTVTAPDREGAQADAAGNESTG